MTKRFCFVCNGNPVHPSTCVNHPPVHVCVLQAFLRPAGSEHGDGAGVLRGSVSVTRNLGLPPTTALQEVSTDPLNTQLDLLNRDLLKQENGFIVLALETSIYIDYSMCFFFSSVIYLFFCFLSCAGYIDGCPRSSLPGHGDASAVGS
jgi:hypothetical protein